MNKQCTKAVAGVFGEGSDPEDVKNAVADSRHTLSFQRKMYSCLRKNKTCQLAEPRRDWSARRPSLEESSPRAV